MASGVPVITSDQASLPEVAGGAGIMVDPNDTATLREEMLRLIEDGLLSVDELVSTRWPLDSLREGFAAVMRGSGLKHVVSFERR